MIRNKRIISFFLAAMIIFCGLPVNAYGTEKTSTEVDTKSMNGKIEYIGNPLLLAANEMSETVSVLEIDDSNTVSIASISDPHYFSPSLGTTGAAFQAYLNQDRKLIAESSAISEAAVDKLKVSGAGIVLVTGDLTKDGEKVSHEEFAGLLKELEDAGKKVYVVAGNHDINNPHSKKYVDDSGNPTDADSNTPSVTPEEFKGIYNDFGFEEAIATDPNSLSYVAEPVDGLWIISMDSAIYDDVSNATSPETSGAFSEETFDWILDKVEEGRSKGKRVIGMTHHGIVEHFAVQNMLFDEYVIDGIIGYDSEDYGGLQDWEYIADSLADAGMEVVFTGHFHANDIAQRTANGNTIYDIETGSLVTAPSPYRISTLSFNDNTLSITTDHIEEIDYTGAENFPEYSEEFLIDGLEILVENLLPGVVAAGSGGAIPIEQATGIINIPVTASAISGSGIVSGTAISLSVNALAAHYAGDEAQAEGAPDQISLLTAMSQSQDQPYSPIFQYLARAILSIYIDPTPDNHTVLELNSVPAPEPDDDDDDDDRDSGEKTPKPTPDPTPTPEPTTPTTGPETNFGDIGNHWAESLIKEAVSRNLFRGVGNNSFEPDRNITRAEIAAVLVRGLGLQAGGTNSFSDVNSGDWFHNDISAVFSNGLMVGYGDGTARPNNPITRQEAMVIIAKALQYKGMDINISEDEISQYLSAFGDSGSISGWARQYAAICVKSKIFEGSNSLLRPGDNITRAEAVKIIMYLLNL